MYTLVNDCSLTRLRLCSYAKMAAARAYIDGLLNQDITGKTKSKMINLHTVSTAGI